MNPICLKHLGGSALVTEEQALQFLTKEEIEKEEKRFDIETKGAWHTVSKVAGLATFHDFKTHDFTLLGYRSLDNPSPLGYDMEGQVTYQGKKYRAFTSSCLFELPGKKLVNVAILHLCKGEV